MTYGVGNACGIGSASDLFFIEGAMAQALYSGLPAERWKMAVRCREIAYNLLPDECAARYARAAGCMWDAGEDIYNRMREMLQEEGDILGPEGISFVEYVLGDSARGRIPGSSQFICDVITKAIDAPPTSKIFIPSPPVTLQ